MHNSLLPLCAALDISLVERLIKQTHAMWCSVVISKLPGQQNMLFMIWHWCGPIWTNAARACGPINFGGARNQVGLRLHFSWHAFTWRNQPNCCGSGGGTFWRSLQSDSCKLVEAEPQEGLPVPARYG